LVRKSRRRPRHFPTANTAQVSEIPEIPTKPFSGPGETILKQAHGKSAPNKLAPRRLEAQMNHSIHSADRATHRKIVVVALVAGIAVAGLGIFARAQSEFAQTAHVVKAGKPVAVTSSDAMLVR
jgi:hypothetical protein